MGDRGEVGTIGFDEQTIGWNRLGNLPQHAGILKGEDAGKREIKPQIQRILRQPGIA